MTEKNKFSAGVVGIAGTLFLAFFAFGLLTSTAKPHADTTVAPSAAGANAADGFNWQNLLDAIAEVESANDPNAVGDGGRAVGLYQIHPVYVEDVNRIIGTQKYRLSDRANPITSAKMVRIYLSHYGNGKSVGELARIHNGGPAGYKKECTKRYGQRIAALMQAKRNQRTGNSQGRLRLSATSCREATNHARVQR